MSSIKYKTEMWQGREVMPGTSMRFSSASRTPKPLKMRRPFPGEDFSEGLPKHRPSPESYTVLDALVAKLGGKREYGKFRDHLNRSVMS